MDSLIAKALNNNMGIWVGHAQLENKDGFIVIRESFISILHFSQIRPNSKLARSILDSYNKNGYHEISWESDIFPRLDGIRITDMSMTETHYIGKKILQGVRQGSTEFGESGNRHKIESIYSGEMKEPPSISLIFNFKLPKEYDSVGIYTIYVDLKPNKIGSGTYCQRSMFDFSIKIERKLILEYQRNPKILEYIKERFGN